MVEYVEPYSVPEDEREKLVKELQSERLKPWTLLKRAGVPHKAMKQMILDYEIKIDIDGYLYLPEES